MGKQQTERFVPPVLGRFHDGAAVVCHECRRRSRTAYKCRLHHRFQNQQDHPFFAAGIQYKAHFEADDGGEDPGISIRCPVVFGELLRLKRQSPPSKHVPALLSNGFTYYCGGQLHC